MKPTHPHTDKNPQGIWSQFHLGLKGAGRWKSWLVRVGVGGVVEECEERNDGGWDQVSGTRLQGMFLRTQ